jgi:hypothetical protein
LGKTQSGFAVAIRFIIGLFVVRDIKVLIGVYWGMGNGEWGMGEIREKE